MRAIIEGKLGCVSPPKAVKTVVGTGAEGSTYAQGTQALQAGTMNAAELMQWQNQVGSISKEKFADIIAHRGLRQSAGRHHRDSAGEIRHEGRDDLQE